MNYPSQDPPQYAIETHGLSKVYSGGVHAVRGLDLAVPPGTCFGLLGPNGAGKSTLVKVLLSIVRITSGDATIFGRDIRDPEARRSVGYLPEGHRFPRYLTGRGVCRYFGKLSGMSGAELEHDIDEKLALVGMSEWADTKITKYSKGMNQRVGLAQALLGNPDLVLLDEPTDGVDPVGRKEIREVIRESAAAGTTIFVNSHLLSEVEVMCDYVAIMHKGEVIEQGTVADIKRKVSADDQGGLEVRFRTSKFDDAAWNDLSSRFAFGPRDGNHFSSSMADESEIDGVVDALREAGVSIYEIRVETKTLEDAFIELIQETGDTGVGGAKI